MAGVGGRGTTVRDDLVARIWRGADPFTGFPRGLYRTDLQGWNQGHPYLVKGVRDLRPAVAAEVGVWKGASSIAMAAEMARLGLDGVLLGIDTWLGAWDHWGNDEYFPSLAVEHGQPMLMRTFMANVVEAGVEDTILPLPLDSLNAAMVLRAHGVRLDLLHLDAGHDEAAVTADLAAWWPLIRPGGLLIGDDYLHDGLWPGVRAAFDAFFGALGLAPFEFGDSKCRIRKPREDRPRPAAAAPTSP